MIIYKNIIEKQHLFLFISLSLQRLFLVRAAFEPAASCRATVGCIIQHTQTHLFSRINVAHVAIDAVGAMLVHSIESGNSLAVDHAFAFGGVS